MKIDRSSLSKSTEEVLFVTCLALLPLGINITIQWIVLDSLPDAIKEVVVPGELISYCLSFIAQSLFLILYKAQGTSYKLPGRLLFTYLTGGIYLTSLLLVLIAKNHWIPTLNPQQKGINAYFNVSLGMLILAIIFRVYATYHNKGISNFAEIRNEGQKDLNDDFRKKIKRK